VVGAQLYCGRAQLAGPPDRQKHSQIVPIELSHDSAILHNGYENFLLPFCISQCNKLVRETEPPTMLAQLKLDTTDETSMISARHLTLVRQSLWDHLEAPAADWAGANPEKLMAFLMVAQEDFAGLGEIVA